MSEGFEDVQTQGSWFDSSLSRPPRKVMPKVKLSIEQTFIIAALILTAIVPGIASALVAIAAIGLHGLKLHLEHEIENANEATEKKLKELEERVNSLSITIGMRR
jgi:hypothetical protein